MNKNIFLLSFLLLTQSYGAYAAGQNSSVDTTLEINQPTRLEEVTQPVAVPVNIITVTYTANNSVRRI